MSRAERSHFCQFSEEKNDTNFEKIRIEIKRFRPLEWQENAEILYRLIYRNMQCTKYHKKGQLNNVLMTSDEKAHSLGHHLERIIYKRTLSNPLVLTFSFSSIFSVI